MHMHDYGFVIVNYFVLSCKYVSYSTQVFSCKLAVCLIVVNKHFINSLAEVKM